MITNPTAAALAGSVSTANASLQQPKTERDMFMTLLVAQLKNQDPLAPQDGTEFVAQLAQFNSLDQLIGIRQSIEQLTFALNQTRRA
jgi:flagellar basal-body rod modification protein FlgD